MLYLPLLYIFLTCFCVQRYRNKLNGFNGLNLINRFCFTPQSFKKEIRLNTNRIDALIVFGESLIQRSCPQDAVEIEDELEQLHTYCQDVFGRVSRFHQHLTSLPPVLYLITLIFDYSQHDCFDGINDFFPSLFTQTGIAGA